MWKVWQDQATSVDNRVVQTTLPLIEETKIEDESKEPEPEATFGCLIRSNIPILNSFQSLAIKASTSTGNPKGFHPP